MRRVIAGLLVAALGMGGCVRSVAYRPRNLPTATAPQALVAPGTHVLVGLQAPVMSGMGGMASLVVLQDVRGSDGTVVMPSGTRVFARVVDRPARRLGRPGRLTFELYGAYTANAAWVPIQGRAVVTGRARRGAAYGLAIGMSFLYFPLSLLHLLARGRPAMAGPNVLIDGVVTS